MSFTATSYRLSQPHSSDLDVPHGLEKRTLDSFPIKFRAQLIHLLIVLLDIDGRDDFYLQELWVFGSCARGDAHPFSDIDLLAVIADGCTNDNPQLLAGREIAKSAACIDYDLSTVSIDLWTREQDNICTCFPDIKRERVLIYARR